MWGPCNAYSPFFFFKKANKIGPYGIIEKKRWRAYLSIYRHLLYVKRVGIFFVIGYDKHDETKHIKSRVFRPKAIPKNMQT